MRKTKQASRSVTSAKTGTFVLGRRAFAKVSAIEGITVSRRLEADLHELEDLNFEARREALTEKYGKS